MEEIRQSAKPGRADDAIGRLRRASELLERGDAKGASVEAKKARDERLAHMTELVLGYLGKA